MWEIVDQDKWEWSGDDDRHYLRRIGDSLIEYHNGWMHAYRVGDIADETQPTADAVWKFSEARDDLRGASDEMVWAAFMSPVYTR